MANLCKTFTAGRLLAVAALLACSHYVSAAQLGGRRALHSWVPESGSFSVETGVSKPSTVKSKTEVTWDHNAKPSPAPEPAAAAPPAPPKSSPAPEEEKTVKGKQIDFSFDKTVQHAVEINKDVIGTKQVLVKEKPQLQVAVNVDKASASKSAAPPASPPSPEKETTYVISARQSLRLQQLCLQWALVLTAGANICGAFNGSAPCQSYLHDTALGMPACCKATQLLRSSTTWLNCIGLQRYMHSVTPEAYGVKGLSDVIGIMLRIPGFHIDSRIACTAVCRRKLCAGMIRVL